MRRIEVKPTTPQQDLPPSNALLRRRQVEHLVKLSRSSIYAAVKNKSFPSPVRIGVRAVAWRQTEVEDWLAARPYARPSQAATAP